MTVKRFVRDFEIDKRSDYTIIDIIRVLFILSEGPMGRIRLINELDMGEATVKTIIKRLGKEGLLTDSTKGQVLTESGKVIASSISRKMSVFREFRIPLFSKKICDLFIVRSSEKRVGMGIEQRDEGMKAGADIVTLVYDGLNVKFPKTGEKVELPDDNLNLKKGDVLIFSSGKERVVRERGGIAAALTLF